MCYCVVLFLIDVLTVSHLHLPAHRRPFRGCCLWPTCPPGLPQRLQPSPLTPLEEEVVPGAGTMPPTPRLDGKEEHEEEKEEMGTVSGQPNPRNKKNSSIDSIEFDDDHDHMDACFKDSDYGN
ncbi:unnamed protein product [Oncorhynchus mykiss]|uniref:Uncharacterized protein n=1 Tax=Oncorhynchus mykiss TaxID=8022 RepID=A0A060ZFC2_ONCMY|nr:unnamed protein product [Oncorhynchus mykiss]